MRDVLLMMWKRLFGKKRFIMWSWWKVKLKKEHKQVRPIHIGNAGRLLELDQKRLIFWRKYIIEPFIKKLYLRNIRKMIDKGDLKESESWERFKLINIKYPNIDLYFDDEEIKSQKAQNDTEKEGKYD